MAAIVIRLQETREPTKKNVQGSRYDSATRLHADVRFAASAPDRPPIARHHSLSARDGSMQQTRRHRTTPTGVGISIRPFARSQRRLRHHCEVYVPGLYLRFHIEDLRESVRFPAPSLRSVSRPNRGDLNTRNPLLTRSPTFLISPRSPLPFGSFSKPSGSKRSTGSFSENPPYPTFDRLLLPAASSCDSATDQCLKLASYGSAIVP